jgi:hypothetical protein
MYHDDICFIPVNELYGLALEPVIEALSIVKHRRDCTSLNIAVLDGKPAPRFQQIFSNSVSTISPFANRNASFQTARDPRFGPDYYIWISYLHFSRMSILMLEVVRYRSRQHNVSYDVEADERIDKLVSCWTNRAESRIENKKIVFRQLADLRSSTVAPITIGEVLEVWVKVHLPFAQFLGKMQIVVQAA